MVSLAMSGTEYIASVEGYYNFRCIEFIKITTSRGNLLEVGSIKNLGRCRKFIYEIKKNEIPVSFFGNVDTCYIKKGKYYSSKINECKFPSIW